jgi:sec-independent protein translocase protein TatC
MDTKLIDSPETNTVPEEHEEGPVMGFFEHLEELRVRLFRAVMAVGIGMAISVFFTNTVLNALKDTAGQPLLILNPTDTVVIFFRVLLMLGAILASPVITYQLFMFVLPGLTRQERRWVLLSLPGTTFLFLIGILFAWTILLPTYSNFLRNFQADVFRVDWTADSYIGFVTAVLFWHAVAFETPVIFFALGRMGFVSARSMIKYWRHAIVVAAIVAAIITPTVDPMTMTAVMSVLLGLYILSIVLVAITSGIKWRPLRRRTSRRKPTS